MSPRIPKPSDWVCPYCGQDLPDERAAHCGEVGHAIPAETAKDVAEHRAEVGEQMFGETAIRSMTDPSADPYLDVPELPP